MEAQAQAPPLLAPSPTLIRERYELKRELGRGSYGVVELCCDKQQRDKLLTVKTINVAPLYQGSEEAVFAKNSLLELALKEAQVLSEVRHPRIVEYMDSFIDGENLRIVMEYCPNGSFVFSGFVVVCYVGNLFESIPAIRNLCGRFAICETADC